MNELESRIARWDEIRRQQLSFSINLFLIFSVSALGYLSTILLSERFSGYSFAVRYLFFIAFLLAGLAALFGIGSSIYRLLDFRLTARIVREEAKDKTPDRVRWLDKARKKAKTLGRLSWCAFWIQAAVFTLAMFAAGIAIVLAVQT
ncbi:MAG TPA: hypothetical protein VGM17_15800 [Rhizomicrobium sp.]|jgi:hypothetical protein